MPLPIARNTRCQWNLVRSPFRILAAGLLGLVCLIALIRRSDAQEAPQTSPSPPTRSAGVEEAPPATAVSTAHREPEDRAELGAFVDGVMTAHMKDKHIAGATFAMVVDNQPYYAKGYGLADVSANRAVDPETTMFRIASVSKLFTWTAVMQLAEQGQLDLDADVNNYLTEFKIPATYPEPITLKHLLAHTPGFEDHVIGLFARSSDAIEPLGKLLARELPARVRPAGQLASYSNHGTALAGYIVSQVSGMPWEDYIEQRILAPLEMRHTTVRQPAADVLPAEMSHGYHFARGKYEDKGFEYVPAAPAGSMASSAGDMVKFMLAHLQNGRYGSARILQEETARKMREMLFTHDPTLAGMAYGFMRMTYNGEEVVQHGGDTFLFHSYFVMLPQRNAGFFVSYNTDTAGGAREKLFEALLDRYYPPRDVPAVQTAAKFQDTLARYVGSYGAIRHSYTSIVKLGALFGVVEVGTDGDTLVLQGGSAARRFTEV
ncbi:MAG TPA: serine hydrolase domain-containing protein, partial [Pirellulales bacterium]|nr:serine hydrolase domain-containing protein [Pirellulales bacterium]